MSVCFVIIGSAVRPEQEVLLFLFDNLSDVFHVLSGHGHTSEAAPPVQRDVSTPSVVVNPP